MVRKPSGGRWPAADPGTGKRLHKQPGIWVGILAMLLSTPVASWAAGQKPAGQRELGNDWADYNLDLVAASASQIREVLLTDPGLMVELKRMVARQATQEGQIVSERDLTDDAILARLESNTHFRAVATRLLQRYGYLSPQVNPESAEGREQAMVMRDRAARAAREPGAEMGEPAYEPTPAGGSCRTGEEAGCRTAGRQPAVAPATPGGGAPCNTSSDDCGAPLHPSAPGGGSSPPPNEGPPPDLQRPDLLTPSVMTVSNLSPAKSGPAPSALPTSDDLANTGNLIPVLPDNPLPPLPTTHAPAAASGPGAAVEPAGMVSSESPYAYLPSLHDLYMQAAPQTGPLSRFGLDVFSRNPGGSGAPMDLPAGPDYVVGPGDGVTIDLWGSVSGRLFRTVDREGRLSLPEVGPLPVAGQTMGQVQQAVQRVLRTQYRDISADVSLARLRTVRVYVVGEVASPGAYDISSLSTPLNALFAAGGITPRGSLRELRHYRGAQLVQQVDAYDLLLRGVHDSMQGFQNGDTLLVPPVGPQVTIDGMVRRPAIYELRGETNLAQAIDLAGGLLPAAALRHIEAQRLVTHEKRTMFSINVDDASDPQAVQRQLAGFAVHDGDEIHIFPIAAYNASAVYLQGHVLRPGRYAYTPGMRFTDLVTSYQELLPEPAEHYAEIVRLRPPDWRPVVETVDLAAALAQPQSSPKLAPLDTVRIFGRYDLQSIPAIVVSGEVRSPGQYRTSGQMHLRDAIYEAGGLLPDASSDSAQLFRSQPDGSLRILNVNLRAALDADPMENVVLQSRDRILIHKSAYREDPPSVYIQGEVLNPGRYPLGSDMRLTDLLFAAGGPKRSADLTNDDLTTYTVAAGSNPQARHQTVDFAAVLHNTSPNLPLKDGDVLSVPQLPGWKDLGASMTIKGEVRNPGVYGIRPGERLSSVITRAGGLLPTAFPEGAIFIRPSVHELQEKNRQELIQEIEQQAITSKAAQPAGSGADQAQLAAGAAAQEKHVLDELRRAPVTGRMVIRLHSGLRGLQNSSQDIEVRDGDSLDIPKQPGIVLIVGQVYNSNAITYVRGRNAGWYLSQSGGATRLGDKHNTFIIRANGEITSRQQGGWWSENVLSAPIRPGDTIVVPERVFLTDARLKILLSMAQIAEAGAITAAVVF